LSIRSEIVKRLPAAVPLILLGVLLVFFIHSTRTYIQCLPPVCADCEKHCLEISPDKPEECKNKCRTCVPQNCRPINDRLNSILFTGAPDEAEKNKQAEQANKQQDEINTRKAQLTAQQEDLDKNLTAEQKLKQQQEKLQKDKEELSKREAEVKKQAEETNKKADLKNREKLAASFSGRAVFVFLSNLYFLVCFIAAFISVYIIYQTFSRGVFYGWTQGVFYSWCAVGAGIVLLSILTIGFYRNSEWFMAVFEFLLPRGIIGDLAQAEGILRRINSFGFAVCFLLYLTVSSILFSPVRRANPEGFLDGAQKMKYLRTILYVGTLILVIGMLLIRSVQQWSLAFIERDEQLIKIAENFFSNILAVEGGFFTLLLAAAYLPAAFIVRWQVEQVSGLPQAEAEREKTLQNYNLTFSFNDALPKIIAILGPILAGPVGDLFTKLIK
jgi:hypothetical protein